MVNATIEKFGYPATLVHEYAHWLVLLRPAQVTLGSLVLAARADVTAYAALPGDAFAEKATVIADIERALSAFMHYERINYLMLMMVDPHVHFHVIPRYAGERGWNGIRFPDVGWPAVPDLKSSINLHADQITTLAQELAAGF